MLLGDAWKEEVLAGDMSDEIEDSLVNPSVPGRSLSGKSQFTCSSWSPTAGVCFRLSRALVWSVACTPGTTKGMWLSVLQSIFSHS